MRRLTIIALVTLLGTACKTPGPHLPSAVRESSGIIKSRNHSNVWWTHEDSGNPPRIFAIDGNGTLLGTKTLDVENIDWEDIASGPGGALFVADVGSNAGTRTNLVVHQVTEPDPEGDAVLHVEASYRFRYPDQRSWEPRQSNFDAESLVFWNDTLWIFTKHRLDHQTTAYRFPVLDPDSEVVLERVSEFDLGGEGHMFGGMATAADVSEDGQWLVILAYHALFLFSLEGTEDPLANPVRSIELDDALTRQCEAVAWDGMSLLLTNEGGRMFRVRDPFDPELTRVPAAARPAAPG